MKQTISSTFFRVIKDAIDSSNQIKDNLTLYNRDDYNCFKCFLSVDGKSGYAINNGELISVFSLIKGRGSMIVQSAISNGATRLDCFDGHLTSLYKANGFKVVTRSSNWTLGQPDVVFMNVSNI